MIWETPFGHYYGDNRENNRNYFSNDISNFYEELIKKCNFRIGEGFYVNILKNYLSILKEDSEYLYYFKIKPLISILECEQYLKLSPNKDVRDLYLECLNECSSLYNKYMNVAR